ncbi:hypothetical protein MBANPS3_002002 [Mucor bainieri]
MSQTHYEIIFPGLLAQMEEAAGEMADQLNNNNTVSLELLGRVQGIRLMADRVIEDAKLDGSQASIQFLQQLDAMFIQLVLLAANAGGVYHQHQQQ